MPDYTAQDPHRLALHYLMDQKGWTYQYVAGQTGIGLQMLKKFAGGRANLSDLSRLIRLGYATGEAFMEAGKKAEAKFEGLAADQGAFLEALVDHKARTGWEWGEIAARSGLSAATLMNVIKNDQRNLSNTQLLRLAEGFGYPSIKTFLEGGKTVFTAYPEGVLRKAMTAFLAEQAIPPQKIADKSGRPVAEVDAFLDEGKACNYRVVEAILEASGKPGVEALILAYTPQGLVLTELRRQLEAAGGAGLGRK